MANRLVAPIAACLIAFALAAYGQQGNANISGHIFGTDNKPLAGVKLSLLSPGGPGVKTPAPITTAADGKYTFGNLDAGQYTLRADHDGYIPSFTAVRQGANLQAGGGILTLATGQVLEDYNLGLIPEAVIAGLITGDDGAPLSRVQVRAFRQVFNGNAPTSSATSDEKGQFRLEGLPAGRYYIYYLTPAEYSAYPSAYFPGKISIADATPIDLTEGQVRANIDLPLRKSALVHVRGKVQNDLIPDAHFQILYTRVSTDNLTATDPLIANVKPDGTFDLSGVTPGPLSLALMSVRGLAKLAGGTTVKVGNIDGSDVVLTVKLPGEIKGTVKMFPGGPLPPMLQIILRPSGSAGPSGQLPRAVVASDGTFTLTGVAPIRYTLLTGVPRGYLKSVMLGEQDVTHSDLDMGAAASGSLQLVIGMDAAEIDGTVTRPDGKPAGNAALTIAPDPDILDRPDLYRSARARSDGQFSVPTLAPGKYRVFAADPLNSTFSVLPESLRKFESSAVRVTVEPNGKAQITVQQIQSTPPGK